MNKSIGWIIVVIIIVTSCNNTKKPTNCNSIHSGNFSFLVQAKSGEKIPFSIYRTDSMQIEVADGTTDSTFFSVAWLDDCNYSLLLLRNTFAIDAEQANISKSIPIQTSVDAIYSNFYIFTAERKANGFKITDTFYFKP